MKINIIENKKSSTNSISCFDDDKISKGVLMYENPKIKYPKKKLPTNDEIFVGRTKCKCKKNNGKKKR